MKKYIYVYSVSIVSIIAALTFGATAAMAVTTQAPLSTQSSGSTSVLASCTIPQQNLWYGETSSQVSSLQNFLLHEGYISSQSSVTGYFGVITLSAVKKFQAEHEVPATGFVGSLTRAVISALPACSIYPGYSMIPANPPTSTSTVSTSTAPSTVSITSISPSQGAVGSTATISGSGFASSNTILFGGNVAANDIAPVNGTLTFTIPSSMGPYCKPMEACPMYELLVSKGTYSVTVLNANGTSNALSYTITSAPSMFNP